MNQHCYCTLHLQEWLGAKDVINLFIWSPEANRHLRCFSRRTLGVRIWNGSGLLRFICPHLWFHGLKLACLCGNLLTDPPKLKTGREGTFPTHRAKQVAKADSGTWGPQTGRSPLHLVLAFCRAALSHSSRPRASLHWESKPHPGKVEVCKILSTKPSKNWQFHSFFRLHFSVSRPDLYSAHWSRPQEPMAVSRPQSDQLRSKLILSYKAKCRTQKPPWKAASATTIQPVIRTYLTAARWQS